MPPLFYFPPPISTEKRKRKNLGLVGADGEQGNSPGTRLPKLQAEGNTAIIDLRLILSC